MPGGGVSAMRISSVEIAATVGDCADGEEIDEAEVVSNDDG